MTKRVQAVQGGVRGGVQLGVNRRRSGGVSLDADAEDYFADLVLKGVTPAAQSKKAFSDWVKGEKEAGLWSTFYRVIWGVWGSEQANLICAKTLVDDGSFGGAVAHEPGYMQGDGSTGYFSFGATPSALGLTNADAHLGGFIVAPDSRTGFRSILGANDFANRRMRVMQNGPTALQANAPSTTSFMSVGSLDEVSGAFSLTLEATDDRTLTICESDGTVSSDTDTGSNATTAPTVDLYGLAMNDKNVVSTPTNARVGVLIIGSKITKAESEAFVQRLRAAWLSSAWLTVAGAAALTLLDGANRAFGDGLGNSILMS